MNTQPTIRSPIAKILSLVNVRPYFQTILTHLDILVERDQEVDIPTQLALGVRLLQAQAHDNNGVIHFCHDSCILFDGGTVEAYLTNVKIFLDANPNEVLTMIVTNPDGLSLPGQWEPAFRNSGIMNLAYVPPNLPMKQTDWPTLGNMIDSGKRVVVFLDYGADGSDGGIVDFILPEFDMVSKCNGQSFIIYIVTTKLRRSALGLGDSL